MKIRRIYCEDSEITDMSKDRFQLDLSYNEWMKIQTLIDFVIWESKNTNLTKKAMNIYQMFRNANELKPLWNKGK